ncbi:hypothetical protein Aduo_002167 [Ancylostoma duodenale]
MFATPETNNFWVNAAKKKRSERINEEKKRAEFDKVSETTADEASLRDYSQVVDEILGMREAKNSSARQFVIDVGVINKLSVSSFIQAQIPTFYLEVV